MRGRRSGFTLIEIIVTLAVMVVIMSIAAKSFNRGNSESNLNSAAETLASVIRSGAMSALGGEQFQLATPASWGIFLDPVEQEYTLFADLDGDDEYDTNEKHSVVSMTKNIVIYAIYFDSAGWGEGQLNFRINTAEPYFSGVAVTSETGDVEVQLQDSVTGAQKSIFINSLGAVSF